MKHIKFFSKLRFKIIIKIDFEIFQKINNHPALDEKSFENLLKVYIPKQYHTCQTSDFTS